MVIEPSNVEELDRIIKDAGGKVVVNFAAPGWCVPCQRFEPHYKAAAERSDIPFLLVDVDKVKNATLRYLVKSVPTIRVYEGGEFVKRVEPSNAMSLLKEIA